jgi:hypothetical protein
MQVWDSAFKLAKATCTTICRTSHSLILASHLRCITCAVYTVPHPTFLLLDHKYSFSILFRRSFLSLYICYWGVLNNAVYFKFLFVVANCRVFLLSCHRARRLDHIESLHPPGYILTSAVPKEAVQDTVCTRSIDQVTCYFLVQG